MKHNCWQCHNLISQYTTKTLEAYQNDNEKSPTKVVLSRTRNEPSPRLNWFNNCSAALRPSCNLPWNHLHRKSTQHTGYQSTNWNASPCRNYRWSAQKAHSKLVISLQTGMLVPAGTTAGLHKKPHSKLVISLQTGMLVPVTTSAGLHKKHTANWLSGHKLEC